jgi:MFS family permease
MRLYIKQLAKMQKIRKNYTMKKGTITRTVFLLSLVSLFADVAGEMLYPVMPLYLKSIGMGAVFIGILEGMADAISGLSKTYFGKLSDVSGRRMPFVWAGYILASFSKPAIGLFTNPFWILFTRSSDRLGKGIRTAARDAILSDEATPETKGAVFGFHRSFDTLGAFIGPIVALVFLHFYPGEYRKLFLFCLIPAFFVIFSLFLVEEKKVVGKKESGNLFLSSLLYWKSASSEYKSLLGILLLFTLVNSSDMFLLLKIKENGVSDVGAIGFYIFYNFIYAISSYRIGILSDSWGKKKVFVTGLVCFSITYGGISFNHNTYIYYLLFFFYGIFAASTEGISKAWISSLCQKEDLATAMGFQATTQSLMTLVASLFAGIMWAILGSSWVFMISSLVSMAVAVLLINKKNIS